MKPSRRQLLAGLAASSLIPGRALALGDASKVDVVELDLGGGTLSRPRAWTQVQYELQRATSVEVADRVVQLGPEDLELFNHPFAVLQGDGAFKKLSDAAVEQLHRYISYGGFLYIDDTTGTLESSEFDRSVRRLLGRLFPTRSLAPLDSQHSLYRAFFFIHQPLGRVDTHKRLEGITLGTASASQELSISPIVYGRNDLSGALEVTTSGRPARAVLPGGEGQRREASKLAVNLVMYALTSNYKKDQAHIKALMERGDL